MHAQVLVLGAGLAGLAAARKLRRSHQVVVLEARDRCGGRVHTDRSLGVPVELGATWVHGRRDNPITRQLQKRGLALLDEDESLEQYYRGSERVPASRWDRWEKQLAPVERAWQKAKRTRDRSLGSLVPDELGVGARFLAYLVADDYGEDLDRLGVHAWDEDEAFGGPDSFVPAGLDWLIDGLAEKLDIRHGVVVEKLGADGTVHTSQGTWTADHVICTLPLGVLAQLPLAGVPDPVRAAILALSPGRFHTEVLAYPAGTLPEAQALYPVDDPRIVVLHTGINGRSIAVGHTVGSRAEAIETSGEGQLHDVLQRMLGPLPDPVGALSSGWITDPYTRGAYSSCPPGVSNGIRARFHEPIDRLVFAGEHTSEDYPGTMHGAWISGRRAARQVKRSSTVA